MKHRLRRLMLLCAVGVGIAGAQVSVRLHMPPPGQLNLEQLWWVDLNNTTRDTFHDVWLHGEVREARRGLVYRANTVKFDLPPGRLVVRYRNIRVKDQWHARGYEAFVLRAGKIPAGVYTYSVTLEPDLGGDTGHVTVQNPTPPRLVTPRDGDTLRMGLPNMTWTRVGNYRGRVSYELVVVELRPGQTKERAVRANPPWFNRRGIPATLFRYPVGGRRLQPQKRFAWQVKVYLDGEHKPELSSEVSEFVLSPKKPFGPMLMGPLLVTRKVSRYGNCFLVRVTLRNVSSEFITNIVVTDSNKYFQCLDDARRRRVPQPGGEQHPDWVTVPEDADCSIRSAGGGFWSTVETDFGNWVLPSGLSFSMSYTVLPLLTFSFGGTGHTVGTGLKLTFEKGGSQHARSYPFLAKTPVPGLADAWKAADYMIVTCPSRVQGSTGQVDDLLVKTAELAKARAGALMYLTGSPTTAAIVRNITTAFGTLLKDNWQNGYLLILGEPDVIPAWSKPAPAPGVPAIDFSDYDYADPNDDLMPELKVGRMLGRNAVELQSAMQNALDYRKEGIGWYGAQPTAIFVSGPEPGKWLFVKDMATGRDTMAHLWGNNTVELHTDFITTRRRIAKHALYALGTSGGVGSGSPEDTLGNYALNLLSAWLLDLKIVSGGITKLDYHYPPQPGDTQFRDANGVWRRLPAGFGSSGVSKATQLAEQTMLDARDGHYYAAYQYYSPEDSDAPPAAIFQSFDWGTVAKDIIVWVGHSWSNVWGDLFAGWEVQNLHIGTRPVVIAFGCHCGDYDNSNAVAREFLVRFASVYVGATESMYPFGDHMLATEWWHAWSPGMSIGDGLKRLKVWNMQAAPGQTSKWLKVPWMTYFVQTMNLYGDPKVGGAQ